MMSLALALQRVNQEVESGRVVYATFIEVPTVDKADDPWRRYFLLVGSLHSYLRYNHCLLFPSIALRRTFLSIKQTGCSPSHQLHTSPSISTG